LIVMRRGEAVQFYEENRCIRSAFLWLIILFLSGTLPLQSQLHIDRERKVSYGLLSAKVHALPTGETLKVLQRSFHFQIFLNKPVL